MPRLIYLKKFCKVEVRLIRIADYYRNPVLFDMKNEQDRYFECLELCVEDEQGMSCRQVCAPILTDDPGENPVVPIS